MTKGTDYDLVRISSRVSTTYLTFMCRQYSKKPAPSLPSSSFLIPSGRIYKTVLTRAFAALTLDGTNLSFIFTALEPHATRADNHNGDRTHIPSLIG